MHNAIDFLQGKDETRKNVPFNLTMELKVVKEQKKSRVEKYLKLEKKHICSNK